MIERLFIVLVVGGFVPLIIAVGFFIAFVRERSFRLSAEYLKTAVRFALVVALMWAAAWVLSA